MIKMMECVGNSHQSFEEAVKETVEKLIESGEKIHWFEIKEEKEAEPAEFQVKIKAGVEK
ncbi:MAG: dodecin domain-containing protein [Candidatus Eremiobacterota bacterium]